MGSELAEGPAVTVAHAGLRLHIELQAGVRTALDGTQRLTVTINGEPTELEFPDVAVQGTANESGGLIYPIDVALPEGTPADLLGTALDYQITVGDDTEFSTVVPVAALYTDPSGGSTVRLITENSEETSTETSTDEASTDSASVPVEVLETGSGHVAIEAAGGTELEPGDRVVVGTGA